MRHEEELYAVCDAFVQALWPHVGEDIFDMATVKRLVMADDVLAETVHAFYARSCWKGTHLVSLRLSKYRGEGVRRVTWEASYGREYVLDRCIYTLKYVTTEQGGKPTFRFVMRGIE